MCDSYENIIRKLVGIDHATLVTRLDQMLPSLWEEDYL
jgi:hypothetical protein